MENRLLQLVCALVGAHGGQDAAFKRLTGDDLSRHGRDLVKGCKAWLKSRAEDFDEFEPDFVLSDAVETVVDDEEDDEAAAAKTSKKKTSKKKTSSTR